LLRATRISNETVMQIHSALKQAKRTLLPHCDTPQVDAQRLLCHVLKVSCSYLYAHPEQSLSQMQSDTFVQQIKRRSAGEPIAYIIQRQPFWTLDLWVDASTLIPRPETELLVRLALEKEAGVHPWQVLDLGAGSGAIALALASERPGWQLCAIDKAPSTLRVAQENAKKLALKNVSFLESDWFEKVSPQRFHMIVSNPPYIASGDKHLTQGDLIFEPREALEAGEDGLASIRAIIAQAHQFLYDGGWLMLEHGYDQGPRVCALLAAAGYVSICQHQDINQLNRVVSAQWNNNASF